MGGTSVIYGGLNDGTPVQLYPSGGVPSGAICIWSGNQNNIPTGWVLCDGNNGTPNLSNRFVLGYGSKNCDTTGGTETVSLSTVNMPSHNHSASLSLSGLSTNSTGSHTHSITGSTNTSNVTIPPHTHSIAFSESVGSGTINSNMLMGDYRYNKSSTLQSGTSNSASSSHSHTISVSAASSGSHAHTISGSGSVTIGSTGSGTAHNNMPPYYVLCYIMKL